MNASDNPHLLVVDDDQRLRSLLQRYLSANGFRVTAAADAAEARNLIKSIAFDGMILDVMMPGESGLDLASDLRAQSDLPILMLTALGDSPDRIAGLERGVDDYLPKPFELAILLARLQGLLRRREWSRESHAQAPRARPDVSDYDVFSFEDRTIDFGKLELRAKGSTIKLTLMEAELLRHLVRNAGRVVPRKEILEQVWGLHEDTDTRAIDNFIVRLRRYIEDDPAKPAHLLTVRGVGYRFAVGKEK